MLQAMIIKKVVDIVLKQVLKKYNLSKMKKYVEEPNDADDRIDKLELEVHKLKDHMIEKPLPMLDLKKWDDCEDD